MAAWGAASRVRIVPEGAAPARPEDVHRGGDAVCVPADLLHDETVVQMKRRLTVKPPPVVV